jgi:hypothetical protein
MRISMRFDTNRAVFRGLRQDEGTRPARMALRLDHIEALGDPTGCLSETGRGRHAPSTEIAIEEGFQSVHLGP